MLALNASYLAMAGSILVPNNFRVEYWNNEQVVKWVGLERRSENRGGASMARWENRLLVAALVLAAVVAESQSQSLCPDRPTCFGCNTSAITCEAGGLTSFPVFSVAHQQLVETLWGTLYYYYTSRASHCTFSCAYRSLSSNGLSSLSFNDLENFTSLQVLWVLSTATKHLAIDTL